MARRLVITRRLVAPHALKRYDERWQELRGAAAGGPCHAWRYRSLAAPSSFVEFLEFGGSPDPRLEPAIARAIQALEEVAAGSTEEWEDTTNPGGSE